MNDFSFYNLTGNNIYRERYWANSNFDLDVSEFGYLIHKQNTIEGLYFTNYWDLSVTFISRIFNCFTYIPTGRMTVNPKFRYYCESNLWLLDLQKLKDNGEVFL